MRAFLALVLLCGLARPAAADDGTDDVHVTAIAAESLLVLAVPAAYYWNTKNHQSIDWTLDWDLESWEAKLFSTDKLKLDSNPFHVNALRHPLVGVLDYQIGRTNGLGAFGAMAFAYANGVFWEYMVEFREDPSINDMIANGAGGFAIGEPLYQIAQVWRSHAPSLLDRAHTALFSPWDAAHDLYRAPHPRRWRPWRSFVLGVGSATRWSGGQELVVDADLDVIAHRAFTTNGTYAGPIAAGAWSRVHAGGSITGDGSPFSRTFVETRSVFAGSYHQAANGTGELAAIGTGFTYRFDRYAGGRDRLAMFHLAGPQLQLTVRRPDHAVWIDLALYGDFALVDPMAVDPENLLPHPPPRVTSMQADGYYYAAGFSASGRLRAASGPWHLDIEVDVHRFWQIDERNIHAADIEISDITITGLEDHRAFGRAKLGYRPSRWGLAAKVDGAYRRGTGRDRTRDERDVAVGLLLELDY